LDPPNLARFLEEQRDAIVARFVDELRRKELAPVDASRPLLVDHVPTFLDAIVAELRPSHGMPPRGDALEVSPLARRHGEQRWALGYDLRTLVREYGVLRQCILQTAKESGLRFSMDEFEALSRCLSVGIAEAVAEYVRHDEAKAAAQKANQEFLAEAGQLLASSLDYRSTLSRLTRLIVPGLADWCSVHIHGVGIDATPIAHVDPTQVEVLRDMYRRFPLPVDVRYSASYAVRSGESRLIAEVTPEIFDAITLGREHATILRSTGFRSGMVLPLIVQGNAFGVLMLAYGQSGRNYGEADLSFASELARRAAIAIDNARLYELSQNERSRVEAATRAKDEFVAMVSHELRTPLNAILGWLGLMRSGTLSESKKKHAIEVIERNAAVQAHLIGDLLDVGRIITGKLHVSISQIDLSEVIDRAIEGVRPAAEAKSIQIDVDIDDGGAVMRGDADRLQQVAWNLLANAVKFTPEGGIVEVRVKRVESDFEWIVEDDGAGIVPEFLPHIFESFRQADGSTSRPYGGLGVGLAIAKHIVELHGGTIEAESRGVGQGSTFRIRLPTSPLTATPLAASHVPATQQEQDGAPDPPAGLQGVRVLVVDDDADARELLAYMFEASGMEVRAAGSAAAALEALAGFTPHVIVSDIGMPFEDGYSLIRSIRTLPDEDKKGIPAIALTAFAGNEDRTKALVEGFNRHIAKPVEPSALLRAIFELAGKVSSHPRGS
jgi:signal transduction histidine kinase/ActR/RegA family two-component response regulator